MPKFNLFPTTPAEFSSENYWNQFYTKKKTGFEWYGSYDELSPLLRKCISPKDNMLIVGCGNSDLSQQLYLAGFQNQINIDNSRIVIAQMKKTYPHLLFRVDDVTNLECLDQEISCVLDKGTFDALAPPAPPQSTEGDSDSEMSQSLSKTLQHQQQAQAFKMLREVKRVLKDNGRFVCISLLQIHVAEILFDYFIDLGWIIRISRCEGAENPKSSGLVHPVYVCVFTKLKLRDGTPSLIEFIGSEFGEMKKGVRLNSLNEVIEALQQERKDAYLHNEVKKIGYASVPGRDFQVLDQTNNTDVKYIVHLVDIMELIKNPIDKLFAVFIVPQGRETEYYFSSYDGHKALAKQLGVARLAVVHLLRDRLYSTLDIVKNEIIENIEYITPIEVLSVPGYKCEVLTTPGLLGVRDVIYRGKSDLSGNYVVEDVDNQALAGIVRRLIFLNSPNIIQSEVLMKVVKERKGKGGKKKMKTIPISTHLTCNHHGIMALSIGMLQFLLKEKSQVYDILVIGLGGGLLVSFLHHFFPFVRVTAVELDKEMVEVATNYFGLPASDERLSIVVEDGLKFVQNTQIKFKVIMIDVDNKFVQEGLSCPPPDFLTSEFLTKVKAALLPDGIFVLNLVCRNHVLETQYKASLSSHFPFIYEYKLIVDVNLILHCFKEKPNGNSKLLNKSLNKTIKHVRDIQLVEGKSKHGSEQGSVTYAVEDRDDCLLFLEDDEDVENMRRRFKILKPS